MTRRQLIGAGAMMAATAAAAPLQEDRNMFDELLKASLETKKGLNIFIKGNTIGIVVTRIGNGMVEGRNQSYSRIVIRLDSVDAVAIA
ncbi:MAG: hypothetical protein IANPNBLG_04800 [Bryobacteraceae bacterium]|nr:hypothetical protein [Bryobacteraceae bacterium]